MRNDKKASSENYSFIKETIKEQPTDRKTTGGEISDGSSLRCDLWRLCSGYDGTDRSEGTGEIWNCPGSESSCHSDTICKGRAGNADTGSNRAGENIGFHRLAERPVRWDEPDRGGTAQGTCADIGSRRGF